MKSDLLANSALLPPKADKGTDRGGSLISCLTIMTYVISMIDAKMEKKAEMTAKPYEPKR